MKKRLLIRSLVTALMITSAVGFSSCKKVESVDNSKESEWVPTTYTVLTGDGNASMNMNRDGEFISCFYCDDPLILCAHGWVWGYFNPPCPMGAYDPVTNPLGHYHVHWFEAVDDPTTPGIDESDCRPEGQEGDYYCKHFGKRRHRHVVVFWENGHLNYWHVGGGGDGGNVIP